MEMLEAITRVLDGVASRYEIHPRQLALVPYEGGLPEIVKTYIVCKKIEGLSDKTLETYMRTLKIFFEEVRKPIEKITPNDIRVYLYSYQRDRGCTNRSLDKYRSYLSSFFSWATTEGYITCDPMKTIQAIKYEKKERQNLSRLELEYLRGACQTAREAAIVEFLFSTGCRVSELSGVKKADVDWNTKAVHLFGKGRKHRDSYLNAKAEVTIITYLAQRSDDCEYLFVTERNPHRQITTAGLEKIVRNIAARASSRISKKVTPHVLRHTTATIALQNGMPIEEISKLLGHEKVDTTMIYAHTSTASVQAGHSRYVV